MHTDKNIKSGGKISAQLSKLLHQPGLSFYSVLLLEGEAALGLR